MSRLRTYDLRLWVTLDDPTPALRRFLAEARTLAQRHDGIDVRWYAERRARGGGPRVRIHPPSRGLGDRKAAE